LRSSLLSRLLLTASICLSLNVQAGTKTGEPEELKDLHYGEVLYQLYQENYFQAIVHLQAARQQGKMQVYEDEPELLMGGLYLAYGMPDTAETLFNRVLERSATPALQSKAWLQLAKSRHHRGEQQSAIQALGRAVESADTAARDESASLMGLLQLLESENAQAAETLSTLSKKTDWSLYGEFNRAIALIRSGDQAAGMSLLDEIGSREEETDELRSIRDHANLVLGYLRLESQQPEEALKALQRVRLNGPASSQALLGAGWASLQLNQPDQALVPWEMLAKRDTSEPAVLEVQLAIPYALAQLEAEQQSLQGYRDAIARYNTTLQSLDQVIAQIRQSRFPNGLLESSPDDETSPEILALRAQLPVLLSQNEFIERLQDYRDLRQLERNLIEWREKIGSYSGMLEVQLAAYAEQSPKVDAHLQGGTLSALEQEREALQAQYDQAVSPEEPAFILTTDDEKVWLARLDRVDALIEQYGAGGRLAAQQEISRLMRGILTWRSVTEHPQRVWTLKKEMAGLDQTLDETRRLEADLAQTRSETKGRFEGYSRRIGVLEKEIPSLIERVSNLRLQEQALLQQMAVNTLEERKSLLNDYLIQARFGVASLLDSSRGHTTEGPAQ